MEGYLNDAKNEDITINEAIRDFENASKEDNVVLLVDGDLH